MTSLRMEQKNFGQFKFIDTQQFYTQNYEGNIIWGRSHGPTCLLTSLQVCLCFFLQKKYFQMAERGYQIWFPKFYWSESRNSDCSTSSGPSSTTLTEFTNYDITKDNNDRKFSVLRKRKTQNNLELISCDSLETVEHF